MSKKTEEKFVLVVTDNMNEPTVRIISEAEKDEFEELASTYELEDDIFDWQIYPIDGNGLPSDMSNIFVLDENE